jgi:hypothetical protein
MIISADTVELLPVRETSDASFQLNTGAYLKSRELQDSTRIRNGPPKSPAAYFSSIFLSAASRTPFRKAGASSDENFLASSIASSITTFTGAVPERSS